MDKFVLLAVLFFLNVCALTAESWAPFAVPVCTSAGPKCDTTCTILGKCFGINGQLEWSKSKDCGKEGKFCDAENDVCSETKTCFTLSDTIACGTEGTFPDPADCTRYYECSADSDVPTQNVTCPDGIGYDACAKNCSVTLANGQCPILQPLCTESGKDAAIEENERLFYLCTEDEQGSVQVKMFDCQDGFYDVTVSACVPTDEPGCTPNGDTTQPTDTTTDISDTTTGISDTTTDISDTTTGISDTTTAISDTTTDGTTESSVTDPTTESSTATDSTTESTIATDSTTESTIATDSTTESTITTESTTESPTTESTTETPSTTTLAPGVCTAPGNFPDPADCTKYYRCDAQLVSKHLVCQFGYHFDKVKLTCVFGPCKN